MENGCHPLRLPTMRGNVSKISTCQPPVNSLIESMIISHHSNDYHKEDNWDFYAACHEFLDEIVAQIKSMTIIIDRHVKWNVLMRTLSRFIA